MKETAPPALGVLVILYTMVFLAGIPLGVQEQNFGPLFNDCNNPWRKIDYLFPGYKVGCYLGQHPKVRINE